MINSVVLLKIYILHVHFFMGHTLQIDKYDRSRPIIDTNESVLQHANLMNQYFDMKYLIMLIIKFPAMPLS